MFKKIKNIISLLTIVALIFGGFTSLSPASASSGTPFSYAVGQTFIVDSITFKIVDQNLRYAVAANRVMTADWGKADTYARGFAQSYSYILSSGLPGYSDYNDATFRSRVGNLDSIWEWTSTPYSSYFYVGNSGGAGDLPSYSNGVRPALFLKSGLYKSADDRLYEPLPSTFGDLTIQ